MAGAAAQVPSRLGGSQASRVTAPMRVVNEATHADTIPPTDVRREAKAPQASGTADTGPQPKTDLRTGDTESLDEDVTDPADPRATGAAAARSASDGTAPEFKPATKPDSKADAKAPKAGGRRARSKSKQPISGDGDTEDSGSEPTDDAGLDPERVRVPDNT